MPFSFKLEHVIEKLTAPAAASPRRALKSLAGVRLSKAFAEDVWPQVLEHKWYLSERLGRDVGLRVAAVDYFENVYPPRKTVSWREAAEGLPPRLPMMLSFGQRP